MRIRYFGPYYFSPSPPFTPTIPTYKKEECKKEKAGKRKRETRIIINCISFESFVKNSPRDSIRWQPFRHTVAASCSRWHQVCGVLISSRSLLTALLGAYFQPLKPLSPSNVSDLQPSSEKRDSRGDLGPSSGARLWWLPKYVPERHRTASPVFQWVSISTALRAVF